MPSRALKFFASMTTRVDGGDLAPYPFSVVGDFEGAGPDHAR
jgi:hypothetical protein